MLTLPTANLSLSSPSLSVHTNTNHSTEIHPRTSPWIASKSSTRSQFWTNHGNATTRLDAGNYINERKLGLESSVPCWALWSTYLHTGDMVDTSPRLILALSWSNLMLLLSIMNQKKHASKMQNAECRKRGHRANQTTQRQDVVSSSAFLGLNGH